MPLQILTQHKIMHTSRLAVPTVNTNNP